MRRLTLIGVLLATMSILAGSPTDKRPPTLKSRTSPLEALLVLQAALAGPMGMRQVDSLWQSKSSLNYPWLAERHRVKPAQGIRQEQFRGSREIFARLDRDGNGVIDATDFDWSPRSPWVQQQTLVTQLLARLDRDGDGKLNAREWNAAFERLAGTKGELSKEDLQRLLFPPAMMPPKGMKPPPMPTPFSMVMGFLAGELGSLAEGPSPGDKGPDFTLASADGKTEVTLSKLRDKPVVLIFGSFT
jgi:hypothetical protein